MPSMELKNKQINDLVCLHGDYSYSLRKCFTQGYIIAKWGPLIEKLLASKASVDIATGICISSASRELLMEVIQAFPGKWEKRADYYDSGLLRYSIRFNDGTMEFEVEVTSEPPPSCKIIEVEEEVPARKIIRKKVVCGKNGDETGAVNAEEETASEAGVKEASA